MKGSSMSAWAVFAVRLWWRVAPWLIVIAPMIVANPANGFAQLNGQNIKGDAGLKSGSQAPPGTYLVVPLWFYSADQVKDRNGREVLTGNLDAALLVSR
jgi:hypothetical protein